jgi:hypothetical protein
MSFTPTLKTAEQRRSWFSDIIFKFPYRRLFPDRKQFVDYVCKEYVRFRKDVTAAGREIRGVTKLSRHEYEWIYRWFNQYRMPPELVIEALQEGEKYAVEKGYAVNSIGFFKNQVLRKWKEFESCKDVELNDYFRRFEYDSRKDRWFWQLYRKLYIKYDPHYYFDFYMGVLKRIANHNYAMRWPGTRRYVLFDGLHFAQDALGIPERKFIMKPFPHYRLTPGQYDLALKLGARKGSKEKFDEMIDLYKDDEGSD